MKMIEKSLPELATWERSRKHKIYPAGCTCLQVSATKGQMIYLDHDQTVDAKYCVIDPDRDQVDPMYFHLVLTYFMPDFLRTHQTGLNIVPDVLKQMRVRICLDREMQEYQAAEQSYWQKEIEAVEKEIQTWQQLKAWILQEMLV